MDFALYPLPVHLNGILKFARYIEDAIKRLLTIAQRKYQNPKENPILQKAPIFNDKRLVDIAGQLQCEKFFINELVRMDVEREWRNVCIAIISFNELHRKMMNAFKS